MIFLNTYQCCGFGSVLDPYWIRIQGLSGSGSVFGIPGTDPAPNMQKKFKIKMTAKDVRFKIKIHNSETQLSKNFSRWHLVILGFFYKYTSFKEHFFL